MSQDLLLRGGRIVDPSQGMDTIGDVLLRDGRVEACGTGIGTPDGAEVIDVSGLVVAPGMIDVQRGVFTPAKHWAIICIWFCQCGSIPSCACRPTGWGWPLT